MLRAVDTPRRDRPVKPLALPQMEGVADLPAALAGFLADRGVKAAVLTGDLTTPSSSAASSCNIWGWSSDRPPGKEKALLIDYVDSEVGVLKNAARARVFQHGGNNDAL